MSEVKRVRIHFRVTESDRQALKNLAKSEGQNLSNFLRSLPNTYPCKNIAKQNQQAA